MHFPLISLTNDNTWNPTARDENNTDGDLDSDQESEQSVRIKIQADG
jgi:hypothetical protein